MENLHRLNLDPIQNSSRNFWAFVFGLTFRNLNIDIKRLPCLKRSHLFQGTTHHFGALQPLVFGGVLITSMSTISYTKFFLVESSLTLNTPVQYIQQPKCNGIPLFLWLGFLMDLSRRLLKVFHHLAMSVTYQCLVKSLGCGMDCGCFLDMAFYGGFKLFVVPHLFVVSILYKCRGFIGMYGKLRSVLRDMFRTGSWTPTSSFHNQFLMKIIVLKWNICQIIATLADVTPNDGFIRGNLVQMPLIQGYIGPIDMCCINFVQDFIYQPVCVGWGVTCG